ncbi:MAG: protein kinase [Candidatus Riflebacteria bacterium]|nr:protein kinase [Candidatus Riflebacteria bacterium]
MANPLPPACSSRYRPLRLLGAGGFGEVYLANQVDLGRPVALKVLHADLRSDGIEARRFIDEARLTARLCHPGIVRILDHDVEEGRPWIAYELLPGPGLKDLMRFGPLEWWAVLPVGVQVAQALAEAHRHGVVHRDIKPENILQAGPDRFKVVDFGIAKWVHLGGPHTSPGTIMGTQNYLAPEQIDKGLDLPQSDLYALGVVLFEAMTGRVPFQGDNLLQLFQRKLLGQVPRPSSLVPGVPPEVDRLILKALARSPFARFRTADEMGQALQECLTALPHRRLTRLPAPGNRPVAGVLPGDDERTALTGRAFSAAVAAAQGAARPGPGGKRAGQRVGEREAQTRSAPGQEPPSRLRRLTLKVAPLPIRPHSWAARAAAALLSSALCAVTALAAWHGPLGSKAAPGPAGVDSSRPADRRELAMLEAAVEPFRARTANRQGRLALLQSYLNPVSLNPAAARILARRLLEEGRADHGTVASLLSAVESERPAQAGPSRAVTLLVARARGHLLVNWCWTETARHVLQVVRQVPDPAADPTIARWVLEALDRVDYGPEGVLLLGRFLDALEAALKTVRAGPSIDRSTMELLGLVREAARATGLRPWSGVTARRLERRLRQFRAVPAGPANRSEPGRSARAGAVALNRFVVALWDLGAAGPSRRRAARAALDAAPTAPTLPIADLQGLPLRLDAPASGPKTPARRF